jgi:outer membrane protein TolC
MIKRTSLLGGAALLALAVFPRPASALEPLPTFLKGARKAALDNREAFHTAKQADAQASVQTATLLPSFNANGKYTRNQYNIAFALEAGVAPLAVYPTNQWDALFTLNVPLIDLRAFSRNHAAHLQADQAEQDKKATELSVERQVVAAYYQFAGAIALVQSTRSALAAAQDNLKIAQSQRAAGVAAEVDVQQALAEVATNEQNVANSELQRELSRRQLTTLTGLTPNDEIAPDQGLQFDDAHDEASLEIWEARGGETPAEQAARLAAQAADSNANAAKLALVPSLSAVGTEHVTNANAFFLGHDSAYAVGVQLNWNLDFSNEPQIRAQGEAGEVAKVRQDRARVQTGDDIHQAWWTVHADIVQAKAAEARSKAAHLEADLAKDRYAKGVGTQLEAIQANRDAIAADVGRIQADASLAASRAALRLATGNSLLEGADAK